MMITNGKLLYGDVNFKKGMNNVGTYNNPGNGTVSVTVKLKVLTIRQLQLMNLESLQLVQQARISAVFINSFTRSNAIFIIKYLIKLPIGYILQQI